MNYYFSYWLPELIDVIRRLHEDFKLELKMDKLKTKMAVDNWGTLAR